MSRNKYLRLTSQNIGQFDWSKTADKDIIIRDKEDGEIFAVIERPLDQRSLIADAYHAGLVTGLDIQDRYISFLEGLTEPLMPGYNPDEFYEDQAELAHPSVEVYVSDPEGDSPAENYVYEVILPDNLITNIDQIVKACKIKRRETFYAESCKIWIEDATSLTDIQPYAAPGNGNVARIFLASDDDALYQWLANTTGHEVRNLLFTALYSQTTNIIKHLSDKKATTVAKIKKKAQLTHPKAEATRPVGLTKISADAV